MHCHGCAIGRQDTDTIGLGLETSPNSKGSVCHLLLLLSLLMPAAIVIALI